MTTELRSIPEAKPTDRFKLTNLPLVTPGKCACCGAVNRPVVDFDMTVQFYGAILLCITCLAEAARTIDMIPAIELHAAELSATQSLSTQLTALGMRTITDEQFELIFGAFNHLSDSLFAINPEVDDKVEEGQERLFDIVGIDNSGEPAVVEFPDSLFEQVDNTPVRKRSNRVSASDSDGDKLFSI